MHNEKLFGAWWLLILMICLAGFPVGKVIGEEARMPHMQDVTTIYMPIISIHRASKIYLPVIIKTVPDMANPGFEKGYTGWTFSSNQGTDIITQSQAHTGLYSASLGNGNNYRVASISQSMTVPANRSTLAYWIYIISDEACNEWWDYLKFYINDQLYFSYIICSATSTNQWSFRNMDLSGFAGQSITLKLEFTSDAAVPSSVYVDDFEFISP